MADVSDYSGLEAIWQADCAKWNSNITAINHCCLVLSNPPPFLKLFNDSYDIYTDLKADLDEATSSAGWLTVSYSAKPNRKILVYSQGI